MKEFFGPLYEAASQIFSLVYYGIYNGYYSCHNLLFVQAATSYWQNNMYRETGMDRQMFLQAIKNG